MAALLAPLVSVPAAYAVDPLTVPCADVELVFARGSGQPLLAPEYVRFRDQVLAEVGTHVTVNPYELGTASIDGNSYPAVPVGGGSWETFWNTVQAGVSAGGGWTFGASVDTGVDELTSYLTSRAAPCLDAAFVLGGYSQGAQVIGEAYVEKLAPDLRNRVLYQALFGDPRLNLPEGVNPGGSQTAYAPACLGSDSDSEWRFDVPDCFVSTGSLGARAPYLPASFTSTTGLSCAKRDFVCGSSKIFWDGDGHFTYADPAGSIDKAAVEIRQRLAVHFPDSGLDPTVVQPGSGTTGLDVAFLIDSTGSMGWQIEDTKAFAAQMADTIKAARGRVALVEYKDAGDAVTARILSGFQEDTTDFNTQLATIYASGGGDYPEAALHALMTAFDGLQWRDGATKAAVILTDAPYHDPDLVDASTLATIAKRALEIDPVNVYPIVSSGSAPFYTALAEATTGQVIANTGDTGAALMSALTKLQTRPVVLLPHPDYYAPPGAEITFNASASYSPGSTLVDYEWDYNGDGTFDETTATPIGKHAYPEVAEGLMQVRVTDANGTASNASAFVHIGTSPDAGRPDAPTNVTVAPTVTSAEGISTVQVSWQGSDPSVYKWGLTVDGIPAGMVEAGTTDASITDVHRDKDVEIGIVGFTEAGLIGFPGTALLPVTSQYAFTGFLQPVDPLPTVNTVAAGRAIPVKFGLGSDFGLSIIAAGSPTSVRVGCDTKADLDAVEATSTAGSSSLTYSSTTSSYTYVWKTDKAWAGTCRRFKLTLADGTSHEAMFKFGK
ncbi:PxKF domain-containing protein [Cryobacterium sp. SO1]|uniref:PxKF domain-containing protein n=1 Tax=Cryobacterium sp. SO1 TaxID=1897061 RepID=UPI0010E416AE|nr:PxKF domain-containing protein [Cryobacterium sp. SO1]RZI36850.1 hypothetical protein BJQ95_00729 [Cryobacterium sp. SO1]